MCPGLDWVCFVLGWWSDADGGVNPVWNETLTLHLRDGQYEFAAELWNSDVGDDFPIGHCL